MESIRWFRRSLSVRSIINRLLAAGYRSRWPARFPRLPLSFRRHHRVWGRTHRSLEPRYWMHCVLNDESHFTLFHNDDRAHVHHRQGDTLIDACIQPTDGNGGPSVMLWVPFSVVGGVKWWCWKKPSVANARSGFSAIIWFLVRRAFFDETLCMFRTMSRPKHHVTPLIFWNNSTQRSWTGQPGVQNWTPSNMLSMFSPPEGVTQGNSVVVTWL